MYEIELGCDYQNVLHWSVSTDHIVHSFYWTAAVEHACNTRARSRWRARQLQGRIDHHTHSGIRVS